MADSRLKLNDRIQIVLLWIMRLSLVAALIWTGYRGEWESFAFTLLALVLTGLPHLIEGRYGIALPIEFDLVIVGFLYASIFLGEANDAYSRFWWWDAVLHTGSGVVLGFAGFLILYILHYQGRLKANPKLLAGFAFCFGIAAGGIWEIFEFAMDEIFGTNMQRGDLPDTMWDLIVDALGALFVSVLGYRYLKRQQQGLLARLIHNFVRLNPHLRQR